MASGAGFSSAYTILFHGNCIDGWMSAYIANMALKDHAAVKMFPISPSFRNTWPKRDVLSGTHILLLDVSVPKDVQDEWFAAGALAVNCIDHHESSICHWPADACPINTESCAAIQTWQAFYPEAEIPFWLLHIDRIDRWVDPSYEDRCVREVLNLIAHLPVDKKIDEAIAMTDNFIFNMSNEVGIITTLATGKEILDRKDAELMGVLGYGAMLPITADHIAWWNLPESWLGATVFVIDNTNHMFDSTEAAHLVFTHYPDVAAFVNYRKKKVVGRADRREKEYYVYSARSRGLDLTCAPSVFRGHKTSAGASLLVGESPVLPFVMVAAA
jgi:hypothetical protein